MSVWRMEAYWEKAASCVSAQQHQRSSPAPGNEECFVLSSARLHMSPTSELPTAGRMEPFSFLCRISGALPFLTGVLCPRMLQRCSALGFSKAPILEHELNQINIAFY